MPINKLTPKSVAKAEEPRKVEVKAQVKSGKMKGRNVTVLLDADDVVRDQVGGFVNFLREHAIVGLAVGFIVGQQAQGVVKQLITSFIDPTLKLLIGQKLGDLSFKLQFGGREGVYPWGAMIVVLLNLLVVLATIYILIKVLNLDKLDKPKDQPAPKALRPKKAAKK